MSFSNSERVVSNAPNDTTLAKAVASSAGAAVYLLPVLTLVSAIPLLRRLANLKAVTTVVAILTLLLAIVLDRITQAMGAAPKTSRGPVGQLGFGRWPRIRALVPGQAVPAVPGDREEER